MKTRSKIFLWILGLIAAIILIGYVALIHLGLLEYLINREIKNQIKGNLPLTVHIGDIYGDYYNNLHIRDIYIFYDDSMQSYNMAHLPHIYIEYSLEELWLGELGLRNLQVDSALVTLRKNNNGEWLLPKGKAEKSGSGGFLNFEVENIKINELGIVIDRDNDSLLFNNVNLAARVQARENTYSAILDYFGVKSSDSRFNMASSGGRLTLNGNELLFQDLTVKTDSSVAMIHGHVTMGDQFVFRLNVQSDNINLNELSSFLKASLKGNLAVNGEIGYFDNKFEFNIDASGDFMDRKFDSLNAIFSIYQSILTFDTVSGVVLDGCNINGTAAIDFKVRPQEYKFNGSVKHFNLTKVVPESFVSDLSGGLLLNGRGFKSENMVLDCDLDLDESWFDEYHAHKFIGSISITTDSLKTLDEAIYRYHNNDFFINGSLDYDGPIKLSATGRMNDLSVFDGQSFIERMGGRGNLILTASGQLIDPDISGLFISDSLTIYDIYSGDAEVSYDIDRFLFNRKGRVELNFKSGSAYDFGYDSLFAGFDIDSKFVYIDTTALFNRYVEGGIKGELDYMSYPQLLTIDKFDFDVIGLPINNSGDIVIEIDSTGFDIIDGKLMREKGYLGGSGRLNYDETFSQVIEGEDLEVRDWVSFFNDEYDIEGLLSGETDLDGSMIDPIFSFAGQLDSLLFENLYLGNVTSKLDYKDKFLNIDSIAVKSDKGYYHISGRLPINLAFSELEERLLDSEQDISIIATDRRLDLVSLMMDDVDDFIGEFNADFKISGSPQKPELNGKMTIANGQLKLFDLINPLTDVTVDMTMIDNLIKLNGASANSKVDKWNKKNGRANSTGSIIINSIDELNYDVDIELADFPVDYELGDAQALVNAKLNILGETPPTVYGDIGVISALYRENFATEDQGWMIMSALEAKDSWDYNINVKVPSNFWIKNDDIDAEISGTLNIIRTSGVYRFIGELEIMRGKGYFADRAFRIEPGGMIFYEDIESLNPRMDIYASTKIRTSTQKSANSSDVEFTNVDLCVHITGTLEEPIIEACADSPYSTEDILTLIFMNYAPSQSGNASATDLVGDRLTAGLSGIVSSSLGKIGSRTLGVETFEIDPVYGDKFDPMGTRVTLGLYTMPNLYIYGRSDIAVESGQELGFEYRLKKFLLMEGKVDEDNLYRLFFNFYWDY